MLHVCSGLLIFSTAAVKKMTKLKKNVQPCYGAVFSQGCWKTVSNKHLRRNLMWYQTLIPRPSCVLIAFQVGRIPSLMTPQTLLAFTTFWPLFDSANQNWDVSLIFWYQLGLFLVLCLEYSIPHLFPPELRNSNSPAFNFTWSTSQASCCLCERMCCWAFATSNTSLSGSVGLLRDH